MKKTLLLIAYLVHYSCDAQFQTIEEQHLELSSETASPVISVMNINGPVVVQGGTNDNSIVLDYSIKVRPKTGQGLGEAKEDLSFKAMSFGDSISISLDAPFINYYRGKRFINLDSEALNYWFICEIKVTLPSNSRISISTVNDGDINISGVKGRIDAHHVNGNIKIIEAQSPITAKTINGEISGHFVKLPIDSCFFESINGDIKLLVPDDTGASISFKSMNGQFYTDFNYSIDPAPMVVKNEANGNGTKYRIEKTTKVIIGDGGLPIKYETLNGNMYLQRSE